LTEFNTVCVYCGSSDRVPGEYLDVARRLARALKGKSSRLVYGGGSTGLMGTLADEAIMSGLDVLGIIPEAFNTPHLAHNSLGEMQVVGTIHERKARMAEIADAFIALPGGYGTLEELFEIVTWAQIGFHHKPVGILNCQGYFDHLMTFLDHVRQEGFVYKEHRDLFILHDDPEILLDLMAAYVPPQNISRWVTREYGRL